MAPAPKRIRTYSHTQTQRLPPRPDIYDFPVSPSPSPVKKKKKHQQTPKDNQSQLKKRPFYEEPHPSSTSNAPYRTTLRHEELRPAQLQSDAPSQSVFNMGMTALRTIWSPSRRPPARDSPYPEVAAPAIGSDAGQNEELRSSPQVGIDTSGIMEGTSYAIEEDDTMHTGGESFLGTEDTQIVDNEQTITHDAHIDSDAYASDGSFHFVRTGNSLLESRAVQIQAKDIRKPSKPKTRAAPKPLPKASPEKLDKQTKDKDIYKVEFIISHWVDAKGVISLRVKWEGYDKPRDATWELEESLKEWVPDLIDEYYETIGGRDSLLSKSRRSANRCFATLVDGDTKFHRSWEVKKIVDRQITTEGVVKYKVRWRGCPDEEDEWKTLDELSQAQELVAAFEKRHPTES